MFRKIAKLLIIVGVLWLARAGLKRWIEGPEPPSPGPPWPPLGDVGLEQERAPASSTGGGPTEAPKPSAGGGRKSGTGSQGGQAWVQPNEDGTAPASHPVKAKTSSKLYHLPGMAAYERTKPDRCYGTPEAAEADGFTREEVSKVAGPLVGVKVVEVGVWVAGPSAAAILGDWGAEVTKIEPMDGDPFRGFLSGFGIAMNPPFELDNRNKRSIALDLSIQEGRTVAGKLVDAADVFVTNVRPLALERAGLDYDTLASRNPGLVYASVTGYGLDGADRDRAAYDVGAFWSRAGVAAALTLDGDDPPYQRGGMGDHMAGLAAAGGVCAALVSRGQSGRGQLVSTSLMRIGMYMLGWDVNTYLRAGVPTIPMTRKAPPNPLINVYTAGDGRRFWLLGLQGDRHWPDIVRAVEQPGLLEDQRYKTIIDRLANSAALVAELDSIFATRSSDKWAEAFDREGVWWSPFQTADEAVADPQAEAGGAFVEVPSEEGPVRMVSAPVDFAGTPWEARSMPPEAGQHTEELLLELGYSWEDIIAMKDAGAVL